MGSRKSDPMFGDGASPAKIFIGGLAKDATLDQFTKYFGKYGEITDSVIMKERHTGKPRGFGFVTYADPSVVDTVIAETHIINGKQVEIKRTIPKGASESNSRDFKTKDFKTKKIFVGGIPTSVTEDEFKNFFSKYGKVVEQEIIKDHTTNRSRGFGFLVFDNEQVVDDLLVNGNMIDMGGSQVEVKKAQPKKSSNPGVAPPVHGSGRGRGNGDSYHGFNNSYSDYGSANFAPAPYRVPGTHAGRFGDYGGYGGGGSGFGGRYGDFGGSDYMGYRGGDAPLGYGRFGSYGSGGFGGGYGENGFGSYGRGGVGGSYGGVGGYGGGYGGYGPGAGGYDSAPPGAGYGGRGGSMYGTRGGYSGGSRFHPYAR